MPSLSPRVLSLVAVCALLLSAAALLLAWNTGRADAGYDHWLKGSADEKFEKVALHLRGMDAAMFEIGLRYRELAWAGEHEEWAYAKQQVEKIEKVMALVAERRPARAASFRAIFLDSGVTKPLSTAIEQHDRTGFAAGFRTLSAACIGCHAVEKAPLIHIDSLLGPQAANLKLASTP